MEKAPPKVFKVKDPDPDDRFSDIHPHLPQPPSLLLIVGSVKQGKCLFEYSLVETTKGKKYIKNVVVGDTITLEMQAITEEYYNYISQLLTETVWNMGPLDGPPANPTGNISNGAMGFFLAYSKQEITRVIPEKDKWILLEWF